MKLSDERNVLLEKEDGSHSFKYPILKTAEYPHPELVDNIQGFAVNQGAETLHNSYHTYSQEVKYTTEVDRYINWINELCKVLPLIYARGAISIIFESINCFNFSF